MAVIGEGSVFLTVVNRECRQCGVVCVSIMLSPYEAEVEFSII